MDDTARKHKSLARFGFFACLAVCLPLATLRVANAQSDNFYQFGRYHWTVPLPVDHGYVDASNGNLHLSIPIASIAERGHIPYTATLVYDSHIWQQVPGTSTTWQPTNVPGTWGGWRLVTSDGTGSGFIYHTQFLTCSYTVSGRIEHAQYTAYQFFKWQAEDGHTVSFPGQTSTGNICHSAVASANSLDSQQWGYHLYVTNYNQATIFAADGTQVFPKVQDTNGNAVNTMGGTPLSTSTNGSTTTYSIVNSAPGSSTPSYSIVVTTESIPVNTAFGQSGVTEYSGSITVVQSITLPDGSTYQFSYDQGSTGTHYGSCAGMTMPTGGSVSFSHSVFQNAMGERNLFVASYSSGGGTWTYSPSVVSSSCPTSCTQSVTVTKPNASGSSDTETHFLSYSASPVSAFLDTAQTYYTGASTVLKTVSETYSGDLPQSIGTVWDTATGSVGTKTQYVYDTNGFGNVVEKEEWGFYISSPPSSPYRTVQYGFLANSDNNMVDKQTSVTVTAGGPTGTTEAETVVNYDSSALTSETGAFGHDDTNFGTGYTARGNPTQIQELATVGGSLVTTGTLAYDTTGQALSARDSNGNQTSFSYADNYYTDNGSNPPSLFTPPQLTNAFVTKVTNALNNSATLGYYYASGSSATTQDENGANSYFHFDSFNRPTSSILPAGAWTLNNYVSVTQQDEYTSITTTTPSTGCSSCFHVEALLDNLGRPSQSVLVSDPDGQTNSEVSYGTDGRVQTSAYPFRSGSNGSDTYAYDGLGRVTQVTHADGTVAATYYGAQVTGAVGGNTSQSCSTTTYGVGYPTLLVDESGRKRQIWQDAFGRTIEADEPDSSNNLTKFTCYQYDFNDNLTKVVSATGQTRTYQYDALSRLTSVATPETLINGTQYSTTFSYLNGSTPCSGNPSAVCSRTDSRGIVTTYTYDALNRVTKIAYSDSTPTVTYCYDGNNTACISGGFSSANGKGRRTAIADGSGTCGWSYDAMGHVLTEQKTIAGITKTISYSYNLDGSLATITYPSGRVLSYSTGNAGRPVSAADSNGSQYAAAAAYAPQGALATVLYGKVTGGFNGTTESRAYNNRLELTSVQASSTNGTALSLSPCYTSFSLSSGCSASTVGKNGSLTGIINSADTNETQVYGYDHLNRILSAATKATSGNDCWGQNFGIDAVANLTGITVTQCSAGSLSVSTDSNNHLTGGTFAYDNAGNMANDGAYTYTYDAENRITSANGVTYTYDGDGLRVKKSSGTLYWRSYSGDVLAESDLSGNIINEYVFFAGRRIARTSGSTVNYFYSDTLGTLRTITDATGHACYDANFTPYGQEILNPNISQTCSSNYKFTGYEYDSETGLYYAYARYYNPRLGRFMSPDPLMGSLSNPQSLDRYAYVANDPLNLVDPSGMQPRQHPLKQNMSPWGFLWGPNFEPGDVSFSCGYSLGGDCTILGNDVFDALSGEPGTFIGSDRFGNFQWGWSFSLYSVAENFIDNVASIINGTRFSASLNNGPVASIPASPDLASVPTYGFVTFVESFGTDTEVTGFIPDLIAAQTRYYAALASPAGEQFFSNFSALQAANPGIPAQDILEVTMDIAWTDPEQRAWLISVGGAGANLYSVTYGFLREVH